MALPNEAFAAIGVAIGALAKPVFDWLRGRKTASVDEMERYRRELDKLIARQDDLLKASERKVNEAESGRDAAIRRLQEQHDLLDVERGRVAALTAERDLLSLQNADLRNEIAELALNLGTAKQELQTLKDEFDELLERIKATKSEPPPPKES